MLANEINIFIIISHHLSLFPLCCMWIEFKFIPSVFVSSSYVSPEAGEDAQGSHSTEENVLTVRDLKNIFVDGDD